MPEKFPEGTKFFYCDFFPSAQFPDGIFKVYDPDEREIAAEVAIPTVPGILTEAEFRAKVAAYNSAV